MIRWPSSFGLSWSAVERGQLAAFGAVTFSAFVGLNCLFAFHDVARPKLAQAQVPVPTAAPTPAETLSGSAEAGEDSAGTSNREAPPLPEIEDPMLVSVAPPPNVLQSWRQALQLVRSRSTSLAIAEAQVEAAAGQARTALSRSYPTLSANGNVRRHLLFGTGTNITAAGPQINVRIPDPATVWTGSLSFRQPLLAPRAWQEAETAKISVKAAQQRVHDAERQILASVADTIVAVVTAERLAEVSRVALRSSLSTLDLTRRRARLGAGNAVDVLRAEQEVALNRAQMVSANEGLRQAREALGMALGFSEPWGVTVDVNLNELARDARQVCSPVDNVDDRADVRAAEIEVEVAERRVDATDWVLSPTLDLVSDLTYSTAPFTANGTPTQWTVGALLTIPLYDGGARYAERATTGALVEQNRQQLEQLRRTASLEVRQALRAVNVAEQNLEVSRKSRDLAQETSRLARLSFVNGRSTSFELVDAARRYQQAELDLAVKEFDVIRARIIALLAQANCKV